MEGWPGLHGSHAHGRVNLELQGRLRMSFGLPCMHRVSWISSQGVLLEESTHESRHSSHCDVHDAPRSFWRKWTKHTCWKFSKPSLRHPCLNDKHQFHKAELLCLTGSGHALGYGHYLITSSKNCICVKDHITDFEANVSRVLPQPIYPPLSTTVTQQQQNS